MVTVECPLCGKTVEIPEYNGINRTDALVGHIAAEHVGKIMPPLPSEGPPLPKVIGLKWPKALSGILPRIRIFKD